MGLHNGDETWRDRVGSWHDGFRAVFLAALFEDAGPVLLERGRAEAPCPRCGLEPGEDPAWPQPKGRHSVVVIAPKVTLANNDTVPVGC